jgi:hypothetical protein
MSAEHKSTTRATNELAKEEEILLNIAFSFPRMAHRITEQVNVASLENPVSRNLFEKIRAALRDDLLSMDMLLKDCNTEETDLISKLSIDPGFDMNEIARNVEDCINKIRLRAINKQISVAKSVGDTESLRMLLHEKTTLMKKPVELFRSKNSK